MYNSTNEFEACILVNGKPVTEVVHNGQTFIEGRKKSSYELYFRNNSSRQVLVVPSVDGLSVIDGKSAGKQSPGYVIDPWDTLTVPGWTVNGEEAAEFIFHAQDAHYADEQTYAEEIGEDERNQGAIGFMVFRAKRKRIAKSFHNPDQLDTIRRRSMKSSASSGDIPPSFGSTNDTVLNVNNVIGSNVAGATYTVASSSAGTLTSNSVDNLGNNVTLDFMDVSDVDEGKSLGTGFGDAVEFETQKVEFERESNHCAAFAFYYDTMKNLRRMGVPVEHFNRHYSEPVASAPNPFPSSPEVTGYATAPRGWTGRTRRKTRS